MKEIDVQIQIVHGSLGSQKLKAMKARITILVSLLMLFFFSWRLALFCIGLQIASKILNLCLERKSVR